LLKFVPYIKIWLKPDKVVAPLREDLRKILHICHKPRKIAKQLSKRKCFKHTVIGGLEL